MRYYIDEQLENKGSRVKNYILEIKDFTDEALIDEYIEQEKKLYPHLDYSYESIKGYHENFKKFSTLDLITMCVEEKFYVFRDDEEHSWNKEVVDNFLNGMSVYNRWTNEEYK